MSSYWRTPTHPGAMTPAQHVQQAAEIITAALFTAAVVAAFAALIITTTI